MNKQDLKDIIARWSGGESLSLFLENGFSVIPKSRDSIADITSTAISGVDVTNRRFVCDISHIQLAQIKPNKKR